MFISQEDRNKRTELNTLVNRLHELAKLFNLEDNYGPKFSTMVENASKKLVDCNAKINMVPIKKKYYYQDKATLIYYWQLRRDGLVRAFGAGDKYKLPKYDSTSWVLNYMTKNNWGSEVAEIPIVITELLKLSKSRNPQIQNKKAIANLATLLQQIEATKLGQDNQEESFGLTTTIDCNLNIPAPEDDTLKENSWGDFTKDNAFNITKITVIIEPDEMKIVFLNPKQEEYVFAEGSNDHRVTLVEYIRVSEEPIYSTIISTLKASIAAAEKKLVENTKSLEKIIEDYGQYLVISEL